jgi:hypothetical protein
MKGTSGIRVILTVGGLWIATGCPAADEGGDDPTAGGLTIVGDDGTAAVDSGAEGTAAAEGDAGAADDGASGGDTSDTSPGGGPSPVKFDLGGLPDLGDQLNCGAPTADSCDHLDDDPWHAIGLNCPGGQQVNGTIGGAAAQLHVHAGNVGTYVPAPYPPQEGEKIVILSSGNAADLLVPGMFASSSMGGPAALPAPIQTNAVSPTDDCATNPALIGTGDCSNTIQDQWDQGFGANDYAEMRINVTVPAGAHGFSYNLAMFSTEYPVYYQSSYNDMYIAWLESEQWTGNISFDDMGHPISLNAGFLDYKDAPNPVDCPAPCVAPELQGTAMEGHAGTRWLETTAGVTPGEDIELVLGVFDLSDSVLDTVVLLDNWHWACVGGPPITIPG